MSFSTEEILIIIGLMITIGTGLFAGFAFCMSKVVFLTRNLATLNEKYDTLEAAKFSLDERMDKHELKLTEMDKNMAINSLKLDTVLTEVGKTSEIVGKMSEVISKIFVLLETKQNKVAV